MVEETGISPEDMRGELLRSFERMTRHYEEMADECARMWHVAADCANMEAELGEPSFGAELWDKMVDMEGMEGKPGILDHLLSQLNKISHIVGKSV